MKSYKLPLIIAGTLCTIALEASALPKGLAKEKEGALALEVAKLRQDFHIQNQELKDLKAKISPVNNGNVSNESKKNWPAKYVAIPQTNNAITFIIRPRLDLTYDQGQSPGDLMAANLIPIKNVDPSALPARNSSMNARGTQLGFKTIANTADGQEITSHLEMDFFGNQTANTVSNYDPRLRYAYFTHSGWTAGQANSLWRDAETEGNVIDYQGSIGFLRQAQLRYAHKWNKGFLTALSLERPVTDTMIRTNSTTMTTETAPVSGFSNRTGKYGRAEIPDVIASVKYEWSSGHVNLRGLYRNLKVNYSAGPQTYSPRKNAHGIGLAAKYNIYGKSNIFGQINSGKGVGHYFVETAGQSAYLDVTKAGSESMHLIKSDQFVVGVQHFWNDLLQSNIVYTITKSKGPISMYFVPKADSTTTRFNKQLDHVHLNTIWSMTKELEVGMEYVYSKRKTFENYKGVSKRAALMLRYSF